MTKERNNSVKVFWSVFWILGILLFGGLYWYWLPKSNSSVLGLGIEDALLWGIYLFMFFIPWSLIGNQVFDICNKKLTCIYNESVTIKKTIPLYFPGTVISKVAEDGETIENTGAKPRAYRYTLEYRADSIVDIEHSGEQKFKDGETVSCRWGYGYLDKKPFILKWSG